MWHLYVPNEETYGNLRKRRTSIFTLPSDSPQLLGEHKISRGDKVRLIQGTQEETGEYFVVKILAVEHYSNIRTMLGKTNIDPGELMPGRTKKEVIRHYRQLGLKGNLAAIVINGVLENGEAGDRAET